MNVCEERNEKPETPGLPELIGGHLYMATCSGSHNGELYLYSMVGRLVSLSSGHIWAGGLWYGWEDVTDQYCLKRVSECS